MKVREGDQEFLSPQELRELLGFGQTKTYNLFRELPAYRIGSSLRVRRRDLEEWLEANRRGSSRREDESA